MYLSLKRTRSAHTPMNVATVDRIRRVPLFAACSQRELGFLANRLTEHHVPSGTVLTAEGTVGQEFFVMIEGTARVSVGGRAVTALGPGDFFGEVALLDHLPRTATVVAETDVVIVVSTIVEFGELLAGSPTFTRALLGGMTDRMRGLVRAADEDRALLRRGDRLVRASAGTRMAGAGRACTG